MEQPGTGSVTKPALRAGCHALTLLAAPLNVDILQALRREAMPLQELRRQVGLPPQSTMRLYLRALGEAGAVEGRARNEFPTSVDYRITKSGRALMAAGDLLDVWLGAAPGGAKELGSTGAKSTIKAVVEGWSSNIVRALAARPLSLTELNSLIPRITYPSLERRLTAMRQCDLLEAHHGAGRLKRYEVTAWLRHVVGPVFAAMGWERAHLADGTPRAGRLDVEAAFLLATPLLNLEQSLTGRCRLAVEVQSSSSPVFAGVLVAVEEGGIASCVAGIEGEAEAWISGKPTNWLRELDGGPPGELDVGGDLTLGRAVIEGLRRTVKEPR